MKKIITLLIAAFAFVAVHAQTSKEEARRVILGQPKKSDGSGTSSRNERDVILGDNGTKQAQIDQVNREYNAKIAAIRNNPGLSQAEKERMIRQLESERTRKIREINGSYGTSGTRNKRYDGDDDDNYKNKKDKKNKKYKKDNGKHLGWEKGKGNPHKGKGKNWKD